MGRTKTQKNIRRKEEQNRSNIFVFMALIKIPTTSQTILCSMVVAVVVFANICSTLPSCHARAGMQAISVFRYAFPKFLNLLMFWYTPFEKCTRILKLIKKVILMHSQLPNSNHYLPHYCSIKRQKPTLEPDLR